jgi:hypothetical protein
MLVSYYGLQCMCLKIHGLEVEAGWLFYKKIFKIGWQEKISAIGDTDLTEL